MHCLSGRYQSCCLWKCYHWRLDDYWCLFWRGTSNQSFIDSWKYFLSISSMLPVVQQCRWDMSLEVPMIVLRAQVCKHASAMKTNFLDLRLASQQVHCSHSGQWSLIGRYIIYLTGDENIQQWNKTVKNINHYMTRLFWRQVPQMDLPANEIYFEIRLMTYAYL